MEPLKKISHKNLDKLDIHLKRNFTTQFAGSFYTKHKEIDVEGKSRSHSIYLQRIYLN